MSEPMEVTAETLMEFKLPPGLNLDRAYNKQIKRYPNLPVGDLRQQVVYLLMYVRSYDKVYDQLAMDFDSLNAKFEEVAEKHDALVDEVELLSAQVQQSKPTKTDASTTTEVSSLENATQVGVSTTETSSQVDHAFLQSSVQDFPSSTPCKRTSISDAEDSSPSSARPKKRRKNKSSKPCAIPENETIPMDTGNNAKSLPPKTNLKKNQHDQCYNCQHFGHVASDCSNPPRCVKCGKDHASKTCTKPKEAPPCCANCKSDHTSNFRGCPKFKAFLKNNPKQKKPSIKKRPRNHPKNIQVQFMTALQQMFVTAKDLFK